ncbi:MAG: universal stress protein [Actinocatenispora sp.]
MTTTQPAVCAGVDGSPESTIAVDWAVNEARLRNRPLRLVHVLDGLELAGRLKPDVEKFIVELREKAQLMLRGQVDRARLAAPGITVQEKLVEGRAAQCLSDETDRAELMVLGQRGLGGFGGLLLGSISAHAGNTNQPGPVGTCGLEQPRVRGDDPMPYHPTGR